MRNSAQPSLWLALLSSSQKACAILIRASVAIALLTSLAQPASAQGGGMMQAIVADTHHSSGGCTPPLDTVSGDTVAAAFGLQKLRVAYAGNAFTLIRSSDSTTQNIGFVGSCDVDTATISTFCNATTCKVTDWYDQSGNGFDCTFLSGQRPTLTLAAYNGHPKLSFASADPDACDISPGATSITAATFVSVLSTDGGTSFPAILDTRGSAGTDGLAMNFTSSGPTVSATRSVSSSNHSGTKSVTLNALHQITGTMNNTLSRVFVDNVSGTDDTTSVTLGTRTTFVLASIPVCGGPCHFSGDMEVLIAFSPDISTGDVSTLNSILKTYWGTP